MQQFRYIILHEQLPQSKTIKLFNTKRLRTLKRINLWSFHIFREREENKNVYMLYLQSNETEISY